MGLKDQKSVSHIPPQLRIITSTSAPSSVCTAFTRRIPSAIRKPLPYSDATTTPQETSYTASSIDSRTKTLLLAWVIWGENNVEWYWGFDTLPLRHTVSAAEKSDYITSQIAEHCRNSAGLAFKPHRRKCPVEPREQVCRRFSLAGTHAGRFQRFPQANAMRSQADDGRKRLDS
jgi:hypothetical protein